MKLYAKDKVIKEEKLQEIKKEIHFPKIVWCFSIKKMRWKIL